MVETKTGEMMAEDLDRFVNMMGHDSQGFVGQVVHRTHRYLQQEIFILFMRCVGEWARCVDSGVYDGRNEYTCRMSKRIRDEVFEGSL